MTPELFQAVQDELPQTVQDMITAIGLNHTLIVVQALGGTTWRFAVGKGETGEAKRAALAELVGEETENILHQFYARDEIYLPRCAALLRKLRNIKIHQQFDQDIANGSTARDSVAALARTHRLSDRHVWDILNEYILVPEQHGLF